MSDYKTQTIREVRHSDDWGWKVAAVGPNHVLVQTLDGDDVLDVEADAALLLAAALMAAADEARAKR